jgi:hypothetical protein
MFAATIVEEQIDRLRLCTYGGRPFGGDDVVAGMEGKFQRSWRREGRSKKLAKSA